MSCRVSKVLDRLNVGGSGVEGGLKIAVRFLLIVFFCFFAQVFVHMSGSDESDDEEWVPTDEDFVADAPPKATPRARKEAAKAAKAAHTEARAELASQVEEGPGAGAGSAVDVPAPQAVQQAIGALKAITKPTPSTPFPTDESLAELAGTIADQIRAKLWDDLELTTASNMRESHDSNPDSDGYVF
eukprot:SAG11_NODE_6291_length_1343_cov_5.209003_2_plen_186_part_00